MRNGSTCHKKTSYMNVHSAFIHHVLKLEKGQITISKVNGLNKLCNPHSGVLFSNEKNKQVLKKTTIWMGLRGIMLNKRNQSHCFLFCGALDHGKTICSDGNWTNGCLGLG
jgi:hypothetical protein